MTSDQPWIGRGSPATLSEDDFAQAAERIGCDVPAIKAVWEVEAGGQHFIGPGSVIRRFEPHHFPRQHWPALDFAPRSGEAPWRASLRLSSESLFQRAAQIDLDAALKASSWGAPQIMGFNAEAAGFSSPRQMVEHMAESAAHQLGAFVQLIEGWGIASALRGHDWQAFARRYNGSGQVAEYARRMEAAYRRHAGGARSAQVLRVGDRGKAVAKLQRALGIEDDGAFGPQTLAAVDAFQRDAGLAVDGVVGHRTWSALRDHEPDLAPPPQETPADAKADIGGQVAAGTAAVTGVAGAAGSLRESLPVELYTVLIWAAAGLAVAYGAALLWRRVARS